LAPTERPKAKPDRPLPRVPGQGLDEKSAGVWASMSRPDFKALGLLPDDDEPAPQPVEEETPKEVPFSFEGTAVAEKYDVGPELSRTGSSRTHTAKAKEGGKDVLVIVYSKSISPVYNKRTCRAAEKSLAALAADAPHVQAPIESFVGKESSFFVVGTNEGDLASTIKTKLADTYNEKHAALAMKQMLQAVNACHSNNVLHRDATVFSLFVRSVSADSIEVELGNFLSAVKLRDPAKLPTDEPTCSDLFKSPEIMAGDAYGFPSDMWAVGCTAYFLLCGHAPFSTEKNRLRRRMSIKTANVPIIEAEWKDCSEDARDFVKKLLTKAADRLTAAQALEHPWIANLGASKLLPDVPKNITL
jgi:serine/threonine protein kinase